MSQYQDFFGLISFEIQTLYKVRYGQLSPCIIIYCILLNTLRPRQIGRHFADDIFNCIFLNENVWIAIKISLKFVPKSPINNIPALVQIMTWRRSGDKPLSEPMMVSSLRHICATRPQWVNDLLESVTFSINENECTIWILMLLGYL